MHLRSHPVENHILELLSREQTFSTQQLHSSLTSQYQEDISLPQLYKIIQRMIKEHILIKQYWWIQINTWWVKQVSHEIEQLKPTNTWTQDLIKYWSTQYYYAKSLYERENIWADLTTKILQQQQPKHIFSYDTHPYYIFSLQDMWTKNYDAYLEDDGYLFYAIWHNFFMDTYALSYISSKKIHTSITNKYHTKNHWWISIRVLWDYIIEAPLPEAINSWFENIFTITTYAESFDRDLYRKWFELKKKCHLRITHDAHLAQLHKKNILENFSNALTWNID